MALFKGVSFKSPKVLGALAATAIGASALTYTFNHSADPAYRAYNEFVSQVENGTITKVVENGKDLTGFAAGNPDDAAIYTHIPAQENAYERLARDGLTYETQSGENRLYDIGERLLPVAAIGLLLFFLMRRMGGSGIAGEANSRTPTGDTKFDDIAGQEEAKREVQEIVAFLKDPGRFKKLGAKIPKGVLLEGGPGLGKTMLAKAVANEAGVPFYSFSGSDFTQVFAGVGAARVRKIFADARKSAPCIIFLDEIDAMGGKRGASEGYNKEYNNTLNAILTEMDGIGSSSDVVVMAATNRIDTLDEALTRPGRFDRHVHMDNPDLNGRKATLAVHAKDKPFASDVDFGRIAALTPQKSGAVLANIINEAAINAAIAGRDEITMADLEEAMEKQFMGPPRLSMQLTEEDEQRIAYHEAGHVVAARHMPDAAKLHKVTIVPRGPGGGVTWLIPTSDSKFKTVGQVKSELAYLAGGRCAEIRKFGSIAQTDSFDQDNVSSGASNDIDVATKMVLEALTKWGASDKLGFVRYGADATLDNKDFNGRDEETASLIAGETRALMQDAYKKSEQIINENWHEVEAVAQALLARKTLSALEVDHVIEGTRPQQQPSPAP